MSNIRQKNIEEIKLLFKEFRAKIVDTIEKTIDSTSKDMRLFLVDASELHYLEEFKENNDLMLKFEVNFEHYRLPMLILVPEELLLCISDFMMGADGNDTYKGSLTEVQIKSASELIFSILENIKALISTRYRKDIYFNQKPHCFLKDTEGFSDNLEISIYDFCIRYSMEIQKEKTFEIAVLTSEERLKEILLEMKLLSVEEEIKISKEPIKNLARLKDIKINIVAELGSTRIPVKKALELAQGSVIELDALLNADIKVYANEIEVAQAQMVAVDDHFGIQITKINSKEERGKIL